MYLTRKNNILFIIGILFAMLIVAPITFFVLHPDKFVKKENKNISKKAQFDEQNEQQQIKSRGMARDSDFTSGQEEIWAEYEKNINGLLSVVNTSEENIEVILFKMEAVFLSIRVPSEKRDLYLKTFLQIQKLKSYGSINNKEKLREYIVPLLNALLYRNDKN